MKPLLHDPSRCVWLIPTPEFRLTAFESRGTMWNIPNKTSNPKRALSNLLERDQLVTERLQGMIETTGLPAVTVDGRLTRWMSRQLALFGSRLSSSCERKRTSHASRNTASQRYPKEIARRSEVGDTMMLGPWLHHQRREAAEAVIDPKTLSALFRWFRHTPQRWASPRSEVNGSSGFGGGA